MFLIQVVIVIPIYILEHNSQRLEFLLGFILLIIWIWNIVTACRIMSSNSVRIKKYNKSTYTRMYQGEILVGGQGIK